VVDLIEHKIIGTITNVNCPEGSVISPDGTRLYVVTQCGAGQDPVFVIDTTTDTVLTHIPGLAVGLTLAISPDGGKLYVGRGGFTTRDSASSRVVTVKDQLSVITTADNRIVETLQMTVRALAFTSDGKHLLVGSDKAIKIISTATYAVVNTIPLGTSPTGIAITKDNKAYVWLPEENRLFLLGLGGLLGP